MDERYQNDPYKVLQLDRNCTVKQLKEKYKELIYLYHPDKSIDIQSTSLFQLLTVSYKAILKNIEMRQNDKQYSELKSSCKSYYEHEEEATQHVDLGKMRFTIDKFNAAFDKVQIKDVYQRDGYKDWLQKEQGAIEDRSLIRYKEPISAAVGARDCFELGQTNIDDWSGENLNAKTLHFMDCKVAYSTPKLVDESVVKKRKDYNSVDDLKKDRSQISYELSDSQKRKIELKMLKEAEKEKRRKEELRRYEEEINEKHKLYNKLMIGSG